MGSRVKLTDQWSPSWRLTVHLSTVLLVLAGAEWVAFRRAVFWSLGTAVPAMHIRWTNLMEVGAYEAALRLSPPTRKRIVVVGSSIAGLGFDPDAFEAAWKHTGAEPALRADHVWLGGSTLLDHVVLAQYVAEPPPAYSVLAFARRDVMTPLEMEYALGVRVFHTPHMLSLGMRREAEYWSAAQRLWRRAWPGYRYRVLSQQLTLHYRPGLGGKDTRSSGLWADPAVEDWLELFAQDAPHIDDERDLALIPAWAAWCQATDTQPVLWALGVAPDQLRADLRADGDHSYLDRMRAVADDTGTWFIDLTGEATEEDFSPRDRFHILPDGAARMSRRMAEILAGYAQAEASTP